jgi:hypothetical protein
MKAHSADNDTPARCLTCESWGRYHCGEHSGRPLPSAEVAAIARVVTAHQYSRKPVLVGHCTCGHVSWSPQHVAQEILKARATGEEDA